MSPELRDPQREAEVEAIVERALTRIMLAREEKEGKMLELAMQRAFPDGDLESHRNYHQAKIDAAEAEKEFYQTLKLRLAEAGVLGILRIVMWLLVVGFSAIFAAKLGFLPAFLGTLK